MFTAGHSWLPLPPDKRSLGIAGLPRVGKTSLRDAITSARATAANLPFCTIAPNLCAVHPVRDCETIEFERTLADLSSVEKRLDKARRTAKTGQRTAAVEAAALEKAMTPLAPALRGSTSMTFA